MTGTFKTKSTATLAYGVKNLCNTSTAEDLVKDPARRDQFEAEIRKAVAAGYWPLYRYNPDLDQPLTIDSKDPTASYQDFLKGEVRYTSLAKMFPDAAEKLFEKNEKDAQVRLARYKEMNG